AWRLTKQLVLSIGKLQDLSEQPPSKRAAPTVKRPGPTVAPHNAQPHPGMSALARRGQPLLQRFEEEEEIDSVVGSGLVGSFSRWGRWLISLVAVLTLTHQRLIQTERKRNVLEAIELGQNIVLQDQRTFVHDQDQRQLQVTVRVDPDGVVARETEIMSQAHVAVSEVVLEHLEALMLVSRQLPGGEVTRCRTVAGVAEVAQAGSDVVLSWLLECFTEGLQLQDFLHSGLLPRLDMHIGVKDACLCVPAILSHQPAMLAQSTSSKSFEIEWIAGSGAGRDLGEEPIDRMR
ncbi:unnamed protein product, partial [Cladocopium goreaui]